MVRIGRPRKEENRKDNTKCLRLTDDEISMMNTVSKYSGMSGSEVLRKGLKDQFEQLPNDSLNRKTLLSRNNILKISECLGCKYFDRCINNLEGIVENPDGSCKSKEANREGK